MEDVSKEKQRGITLIALVITIIVLLILAGVTINLTIGERGIFTIAQRAVQNYTEAQNKELAGIENFDYELDDTIAEMNGQTVLNGSYSEKNKVNSPNLSHTGLTPVKFSEAVATSTLEYEDIVKDVSAEEIQREDWYSYDTENKQWANAKSADGSLWVWIPRFAYKINYTEPEDKSAGGTIDIVFLKGTTDEPADESKKGITIKRAQDETRTENDYIVHPAFCDGSKNGYSNGEWDKEISGFWIAKFEAGCTGSEEETKASSVKYTNNLAELGGNNTKNYNGPIEVGAQIKYPTFKPLRPSYNYITIGDSYELCRHLGESGNPFGFTSKVDSHMTKNSEWGAVTYLTWSNFGVGVSGVKKNDMERWGADDVFCITGYAGSVNNDLYTLDQLLKGETEGAWFKTKGVTASTTNNVYGIYDLCGGAAEFTAGGLLRWTNLDGHVCSYFES